ncbi:Sphingomyelin phosphodiesterase [Mycena kentingensis (nom. inval.)]|nr:Sphingomyelin phosphodiesterase [Mycena kentingensis (nom. inval.)]
MHVLLVVAALALPIIAAFELEPLIQAFKHAVDCESCHMLMYPLKELAILGDGPFVETLIATCKVLKLEDEDVCSGAISEQGPILAHALRGISPLSHTAAQLCEGTFGLCQTPPVREYTFPLPPRTSSRKPAPPSPRSGEKTFQVVHFSDVHIDREYEAGTDADCKKPICCRNFADQAKPPRDPAKPFGNRNCDSPVGLAKSLLKQISAFHTWSIFTGDVVEAAVWQVNRSEVSTDLSIFNGQVGSALNAPVFPAIGNHDAAPANNFPLTDDAEFDAQWVFDLEGKEWERWTNAAAAREATHFSGSYSVMAPGTNLRIISINTVYWYKQNFWLYEAEPMHDPKGILAFLATELQTAEDAGQRAWIIGHMPPGSQDAFSDQSNYYDQIMKRYADTIAGQFFGHTHFDEFELAYTDYANRQVATAMGVVWIAPALTPRSGNPAFKVYDVDSDTYEIMDSKVYIADMASPKYQIEPEWNLYYSARKEYGHLVSPTLAQDSPLDAKFWHAVTEAFEKNETAFGRYNELMTRGAHVRECKGECKKEAICQMRAARAQDNCHVVAPTKTFGDTERDMDGQGQAPLQVPAKTTTHPHGQGRYRARSQPFTASSRVWNQVVRHVAGAPEEGFAEFRAAF